MAAVSAGRFVRAAGQAVGAARATARKASDRRLLFFNKATDFYARAGPSPELAASIFNGEWTSRLPPPLDRHTGTVDLFEDRRMEWAIELFGDLSSAAVLELGPLEGGHTYMLHDAGARSITSVEGNSRAFLRCLLVKELYGLHRAELLHGDFVEFLRRTDRRFQLCVANGVLYHMQNPVELLALTAATAPALMLWTHYYDATLVAARPKASRRLKRAVPSSHHGFEHTLHEYHYGYSLHAASFCGGSRSTANWLSRSDLLGALSHFGYDHVEIGLEEPDHPNGPALMLYATRSSA